MGEGQGEEAIGFSPNFPGARLDQEANQGHCQGQPRMISMAMRSCGVCTNETMGRFGSGIVIWVDRLIGCGSFSCRFRIFPRSSMVTEVSGTPTALATSS